ncbi:MAG: DUF1338 domain-containing protein [Deltaproteobacteria bacterium]|nr:MAG: DUF1338 domain-containing protein [Deltaproteobacteria bacterium]
MRTNDFFDSLWTDFVAMAPTAADIRRRLEERGERVVNDHVAFRTFDLAPINLNALEQQLFALGYRRDAAYMFLDKKLRAYGYVHTRQAAPRIFLSELITGMFSRRFQELVGNLCAEIDPAIASTPAVFWHGLPWSPVDIETYETLAAESEYAAWLAALGLRPNHFTVHVNALEGFASLEELLAFVESEGYALNTSGGRLKGSPESLLEQGSTLADRVPVQFADGERVIPTCYYEFAKRYRAEGGGLYEGFVATSADRIFESTDRELAKAS